MSWVIWVHCACDLVPAELALAALCLIANSALAQMPGFPQMSGERIDGPLRLTARLRASTLTLDGKPFHAVMEKILPICNSISIYFFLFCFRPSDDGLEFRLGLGCE
jgi:hypothetical protein